METLWGRGRMVSQGLARRFPRQQDQLYSTTKGLSTPFSRRLKKPQEDPGHAKMSSLGNSLPSSCFSLGASAL